MTLHFNNTFPLLTIKTTFWRRLRIAFYVMVGILNLDGMNVTLVLNQELKPWTDQSSKLS